MGGEQSACQVLDFKLMPGSSPTDLSLRLHYNGTKTGKVSVELLPNKFFQWRELATDLALSPDQYRHLPFRRTVRPDAKLINREANSTLRVCTSSNNCCDYFIDESKYLDFPVMAAPEMVSATKAAAKRSVPPTLLMLGVPGGGKSTLTNELIAILEGKLCGQSFDAPTCAFEATCTIVLHNIMANLPGEASADMRGNGGRVRFIDPPGIGPNAKIVKLGMDQVEWMLQGKVEAGSSLNYEWRGDNDEAGKREMHPHVALILVKVSDLMGGTDEWTVKMVPEVVKKANDYGVRVMVILTYPNFRWSDEPSKVPALDKSRVISKVQTVLGVQAKDVFFFWPYLKPGEERNVVKEATSAAILSGALERAIPLIDEREQARIKLEKQREAERKLEAEEERIRLETEKERRRRLLTMASALVSVLSGIILLCLWLPTKVHLTAYLKAQWHRLRGPGGPRVEGRANGPAPMPDPNSTALVPRRPLRPPARPLALAAPDTSAAGSEEVEGYGTDDDLDSVPVFLPNGNITDVPPQRGDGTRRRTNAGNGPTRVGSS